MDDGRKRDESALAVAYRYLNRRERTEREMRQHLTQQGIEEDAVDDAVQALKDQGYLDDARYVRVFAEDKRTLEQWGSERIAATLRERGISQTLIDQLRAEIAPEEERGRALALLSSRFPDPPRTRRERDRALGVMVRRGYDLELAVEVLNAHVHSASR